MLQKFSLLWLLVFLPFSSIHAGAWVRDRGETYSKISVSRFDSDEIFAAKGNKKIPGPDFTDQSISLYSEYGITSAWTGVVSISHKSLTNKVSGIEQTTSGLGDMWIFVKRRLKTSPLVMSVQFGGKLPLGYNGNDVPPLGQDQIDWEGRILLGKSFYPVPLYANAEVGYRRRNGVYSDEIPFRLETGYSVFRSLLLRGFWDGISNQANDRASTSSNRPPNMFDQEYAKLGAGIIFFFKKGFSMDVSYEDVVSGGNAAAGKTISLGVAWQGFLRK